MNFLPYEVYHIYNRGNNKQKVFFSDENYLFFLKKIGTQIKPYCDILCWCLMPNHFHLIISTNEESCKLRKAFGSTSIQELSYRIGILLSTYSQAINNQNKSTGSLFQQKTKSKILSIKQNLYSPDDYIVNCMHYCHKNPIEAGLVKKIEEWPYSSFLDYCGLRKGKLCNKDLMMELSGYDLENFYEDTYRVSGTGY